LTDGQIGHNRYDICQRHGIEFETQEVKLRDREAAIDWIIDNQLGRRNLTRDQWETLLGRLYNREKRQDGGHGNQKSDRQNDGPNTAERLALAKEKRFSCSQEAGRTFLLPCTWLERRNCPTEPDSHPGQLDTSGWPASVQF
jgi:hypothetical protein